MNKILVLTEFWDFKMAVIGGYSELRVLQLWSELVLVIVKSRV